MDIKANTSSLLKSLPGHVSLVAVSKTKSIAEIKASYEAGQRIFGENKIQEMASKWEALPKDISWHMIGHVQRNKVKYMAPFVDLIHGVESLKLLQEIQKQALKNNRVQRCLIQIQIAEEESKFGLPPDQLNAVLEAAESMSHVEVIGLMGMATFTEDQAQIASEFKSLNSLFETSKKKWPKLTTLSMGMSGDYPLAIECGSNMIRVGSKIFGERNY